MKQKQYCILFFINSILCRLVFAVIPVALLPMSTYSQFKLKPRLHKLLVNPWKPVQALPSSVFISAVIKVLSNNNDTLPPGNNKIKKTDTTGSDQWTDRKSLYLYNQAGKNFASAFPAFPTFYFKLAGFTGVSYNKTVALHWQADINESVRWFFIERSANRKSFYKVGEIDLAGKAGIKDFHFQDTTIVHEKVYYYQIKALLSDGSSMTSDFIPVKNDAVELKVSLAAGTEKDILLLTTNQPVTKIEIINTEGQVLFRNKKVKKEEIINTGNYAPGSYAVKVFGQDGFVTQLFIKK